MSPGPRIAFLVLAIALALVATGCAGGGDDSSSEEATPLSATTAEETTSESTGGETNQPASAQESVEVPVDAVAVVDGEPVPKSSYDRLIAQAEQSFITQQREFPAVGTAEYEALKSQAVQFLVQRVEFAQQANELGIGVTSEEVDERLDELKEQFFEGDEEVYEEQLAEQGLSEEQIKEDLEAQIVAERLFEEVTKDVTVGDEEIQAYYEENAELFTVPASREVRHILVTKRTRAEELHAELVAGADFEELAKENSLDPGSKDQGGRLTIREGETVEEFDEFSFSAETGELSEPIKTQFGWHLIEVLTDIAPEGTSDLEEVRPLVEEQLLGEARNEAMTAWVDGLSVIYEGKVFYAVGFTPVSIGAPEIVLPEDEGAGTPDDHGG